LGASFALKHGLNQLLKKNMAACIDPVPDFLSFLPGADTLKSDFDLAEFDLLITLDCGAAYMTRFHEKYPDLFNKTKRTIINIDHHVSNELFGSINLVDTDSAATSVLIFKLFSDHPHIVINQDIATCLLTGVYTDTGSFMHSNTGSEVYKIASELVKRGGKFRKISKECFRTTSIATMKLWGKILSNITINSEGVLLSVMKQKDLDDMNASEEDISGVIDLLNSVPQTKFALLLTEDQHGNVKGSFRTQRNDVNLSEIAGVFGGGGHKKAAGFTLPGRLEKEVRWKIVPADEARVGIPSQSVFTE
ncbi:DHH family phosphoesterase, partial [Candidatus Peregrinibacteria bacterium]|nr:DHH family phosphoesterase [Candidatus Peregrinibacteria bacterium]